MVTCSLARSNAVNHNYVRHTVAQRRASCDIYSQHVSCVSFQSTPPLPPPSPPSSLPSPTLPLPQTAEVTKLQQHLDLLREQYVKLQQKHAELEQKYTRAIAISGNAGTDHFVSHLLKLVAELFDKPLYRYMYILVHTCIYIVIVYCRLIPMYSVSGAHEGRRAPDTMYASPLYTCSVHITLYM